MGHPETLLKQDWRLTQLIFLFNYGLCEVPNVGIDLARKFMLYLTKVSIYVLNLNILIIFFSPT